VCLFVCWCVFVCVRAVVCILAMATKYSLLHSPEFPSDMDDEPLALELCDDSNVADTDVAMELCDDTNVADDDFEKDVYGLNNVDYHYDGLTRELVFVSDKNPDHPCGWAQPPFKDPTDPGPRPKSAMKGRFRTLPFIARCIERNHLPSKLARLCYSYIRGSNYHSNQHVNLHRESEKILREAFYAKRDADRRLHAESVALDLTTDFDDHITPTVMYSSTVIDLTVDSDTEAPARKKRKLKRATNKKTVAFKIDGKIQCLIGDSYRGLIFLLFFGAESSPAFSKDFTAFRDTFFFQHLFMFLHETTKAVHRTSRSASSLRATLFLVSFQQ